MAQKRYSIAQDGRKNTVTVATDATSIGSDVARLIVKDDVNQREMITLIEFLRNRYLEDDFPFA